MGRFSVEIMEHIATLSESGNYTRELNVVSFNERKPRLDVRAWKMENGNKIPLRGLQLTDSEAWALYNTLKDHFEKEQKNV